MTQDQTTTQAPVTEHNGDGPTVTRHRKRHEELHAALDELVADWLDQTDGMISQNTVGDLVRWSHTQTTSPTNGRPSDLPHDPALDEHLRELQDVAREVGASHQMVFDRPRKVKITFEDQQGALHEHTLFGAGTVLLLKWSTTR